MADAPPSAKCAVGTTNECSCGDGKVGGQTCRADGQGWSACLCGDASVQPPSQPLDGSYDVRDTGPGEGPTSCPPGCPATSCCAGECVNPQTDPEHCGVCGNACVNSEECVDGRCLAVCLPDCAGRRCGGDGCGGSCGECETREFCADETSGAPRPNFRCVDVSQGCADGTREGFLNVGVYPTVASCAGLFRNPNMRAPATSRRCGNDLGTCPAAADLCAPGWHVCMSNGWPGDLTERIAAADCPSSIAGDGAFCAATDALDVPGTCNGPYTPPYECTADVCVPCCGWTVSQDNCCGLDGIWDVNETWVGGDGCINCVRCSNALVPAPTGVLCCQDPAISS